MNQLKARRCEFEPVEARRLLAVLSVIGSSSSDTVVIQVFDGQIHVNLNGSATTFADDDYSSIDIQLLEGNDQAEVISNGDNAVSIWGGSGDDVLRIGTTSAFAEAYFSSGDGQDSLYVNQDESGSAVGRLLLEPGSKIERLSLIDVRTSGLYEAHAGIGYASLITDDEQLYGTVDLNDNSWILKDGPAGTPNESAVRNVIIKGYNHGAWNGSEAAIRSSVCYSSLVSDGIAYSYASQLVRPSLNGFSISGNDMVIAYTLCGDSNFDFTVGFGDLLMVAQNYGMTSGAKWTSGDSNYDGMVDFSDLIFVAQNYGKLVPSAPASKPSVIGKPVQASMFANLFSNQSRIVDVVG